MSKKKGSSDLTPLKGEVHRKNFLVLDIESKDGDTQDAGFTRPFMVGVYDGTTYHSFFDDPLLEGQERDWERRYFQAGGCVDKALRFILQRKYRGYHIYAHNAGRFDYLFFLAWLMITGTNEGWNFGVVPVSSAIQVIDVWEKRSTDERKGDRIRFLDSMKLIPTSLKKAAEGLKVQGKDRTLLGPEDLNTPEWERDKWEAYNKQDCVTLYLVVERFHHYVENVLLGEVGMTAPSTAIKLFRRQYLKRPVPRSVETHEFIRRGYFGGRVERFITKGEKLSYFDINSSYPASMIGPMPAGAATEWDGEPPDRFKRGLLGFCEVDVYVPESTHIPVLPVKVDEKLIFPVGNLSGVWTYPELMLAVELGARIVKWKHSVWYKPIHLFDDFVKDLYKYRDKSHPDYNEGLEAVVKIILNASYGKFGMKTLRKKIYIYSDPDKPEHAVPASGGPEALVWYAEEECDAPYIMPQVSAWVTSMSRIRLVRYMLAAVLLGGNIYYCDTDSIITDVVLPSSTKLGELKDEIPEYTGQLEGLFLGPKMYVLKSPTWERVKAKGLENDQRNRQTIDKLLRGLEKTKRGEPIEPEDLVFVRRLEKVGTLAQENFLRGPRMRKVPRRLLVASEKRDLLPNGKSLPVVVNMWAGNPPPKKRKRR